MSNHWYNQPEVDDDIILVSRIRLLRNFKGYPFPERMSEDDRIAVEKLIGKHTDELSSLIGSQVMEIPMSIIGEEEKLALQERQLMNRVALHSEERIGLYASADESFSVTVNALDHMRILYSRRGQTLRELWEAVNAVDDQLNHHEPFAFQQKYGYLTSQVANIGTGMRAYIIMHLPLLSEQMSFETLSQEMSRYGVNIKEAWTEGVRQVNGLYVLYNQRTLGMQEEDIIGMLTNVANRLMMHEREIREKIPRSVLEDRVMRSYGVMKYARMLELPETCRMLSNILLGNSLGMIMPTDDFSVYELLLGICPGNLQVYYKMPLDEEQMKIKRAEYVQKFLGKMNILI